MITSMGGFANLIEYDALIKKFYLHGLGNKLPDHQKLFFSVSPSKLEHEDVLTISDTDPIGPFNGQLEYDEVQETYKKRITNIEYARGLAVQRKLWEVGNSKVIGRLSEHFGEKVQLRKLTDAWALWNHAFDTTYTGGDTLQLCSSAHTSGSSGSNQANAGTLALSPPAVDATEIAYKKFNTNKDNPLFDKPDMMITGVDLENYAAEISKSTGKIDTNFNNVNVFYGRYKVVSSRMLTSTGNWFLVNEKKMRENQLWYEVVAHEFGKDKEFNSLLLRWYVYMFYGFGFSEWNHVYGQNPS
jgi:hypothetical protein